MIPRAQEIIEAMRLFPVWFNAFDVSQHFKISWENASALLNSMVQDGLIEASFVSYGLGDDQSRYRTWSEKVKREEPR